MTEPQFFPGDEVPGANLVVIAVLNEAYVVQMQCCGAEFRMLGRSITRRISKGREMGRLLTCQRCSSGRRLKSSHTDPQLLPEDRVLPEAGAKLPQGWVLPLWPVPTSLVGDNTWWGR
jgi:hypothetical protein